MLFLICIFIAGMQMVNAQAKSVSGTVTSVDDGTSIPGVSVSIKGTTLGAVTNIDGYYELVVPDDAVTLVFSFVGMRTQEILLDGRNVINIQLENDVLGIEEVMVVAYGTTKRSSFTGSATVIQGEKLQKMETSNVSKSLEGAVAGVQISSASGQPGSSANIRIRGLGSISASQAPLIVVDGVPYEGSLNSISPQDIETLNILKDAAANSMYGARGSNGVILITTKQAKKGETRVNIDTRIGVNSRGVAPYDVVTSPAEYYELTWEARRNGLAPTLGYYNAGVQASQLLISNYLGYNVYKGVSETDLINPVTGKINSAATEQKWNDSWLNDPFTNGVRQEYNVNVSGGSENTVAYFSAGFIKDAGYVEGSDFSRISTRIKVDQNLGANIKTGLNISYAKTASNAPVGSTGSTSYSNIFNFSQSIAPIYPIYKYDLATGAKINDVTGNHAYDFGGNNVANGTSVLRTRPYASNMNPLFKLQNDATEIGRDNLSSRGYVEVNFLGDFKFTANIAYDVFSDYNTDFTNPIIDDGADYGGIGSKEVQRYAALNANQLLNYSKDLGLHSINVLVGHETKTDDVKYLYAEKMRFYDPFNPELINAGSSSSLYSYTEEYNLEGYFSRVEYDYDDKYYFSGSFRRDASSKFHPDVRWGNFWSVGSAWRVTEEAFMNGVDIISNLRVKASYGTQGNDAIAGTNLFTDQYEFVTDGVNVSPKLAYRGNPDLTWEKSNNFNVGIELGLIERIALNADFFIKKTKDLLYQKPLPLSGGTPTWIWDNQIDMKNTGYEIELLVDVINSNNLKWDVAFNMTSYKNKLTKLPADKTDPEGYVSGNYWRKIGGSLYDWYRYEYAGVDPQTGKSLWHTSELDSKGAETGRKLTTDDYSLADQYQLGKSAIPDFYGGFSTSIAYYGFDLSMQTAFQVGGYVYDVAYAGLMTGGDDAGRNWSKDIYKRWTPTNTETDIPRLSSTDQNVIASSDRFITDASYFSLKNITLGYNIPGNILAKYNIESVRIYATGDNLLLISARKGLDPRQTFTGTTYSGTYSALRTMSLGISVGF